jgi:hypothetical protein
MRKVFGLLLSIALVFVVSLSTVGCTASQSKINSVIQQIANWAPVISTDAGTLMTEIASFEPQDAAQIQEYTNTIQQDGAALTILCNQYLAAPSPSILGKIAVLVGELATNDSSALINILQIKNPASQSLAKGILMSVATATTILSGYLSTVNVQPTAPVALNSLKPFTDKTILEQEIKVAKSKEIIPSYYELSYSGY